MLDANPGTETGARLLTKVTDPRIAREAADALDCGNDAPAELVAAADDRTGMAVDTESC